MPVRLTAGVRSPFVGRSESRNALRRLWDADVAEGRPSVALVAGEPGIGKTRLAAELARAVHAEGATVLFGRCDDDLVVPYRPFAEALRQYIAGLRVDDLSTQLGAGAGDLARVMPELRELIPGLAESPRSDPDSERLALFEAVAALLSRAAGSAPMLVLLDDLHWADQQTLLLLRHLARATERSRLLIVGTYRDTELGRTHPLAETLADLRRERLVERIPLRGLAEEDVAEMASAWAGTSAPAALVAAVHDETEGNPFFIEEVLAHLAETGVVHGEEGWAEVPIAQLGIPEGIREVVGRRLSRLPEEVVEILSVGAVIGREFSIDVLERCGIGSNDSILDAVEQASRAGLTREVPGAVGYFAFSHALVRQTLYDELSTVRRTRLHWSVGEVMDEIDPGAAAFHLLEGALAGDVARAVRATIRAAEAASSGLAFDEAISWYERALTLLDQIGSGDMVLRYEVEYGLGGANNNGGWPEDAWSHFRAAIDLARKLGDHVRLVHAVEGFGTFIRFGHNAELDGLLTEALELVPAEAVDLRLGLRCLRAAHHVMWFGRGGQQAEIESLVTEAEATGDPETMMSAYAAAATACVASPRVEQGLAAVGDLESLLGPSSPWVWRVVPVSMRAGLVMAIGDRDAFDAITAELNRESRVTRGFVRALRLTTANAVALLEGRFDDAKAGAMELRSLVSPTGLVNSDITTQGQITAARIEQGRGPQIVGALTAVVDTIPILVGWRAMAAALLAEAGEIDEARRRVEAVRAEGIRDDWNQGLGLRWLAEAAAHLEDIDLARELETTIRPYSGLVWVQGNLVTVEGAADRTLGQLEMIQGRLNDAIAHFESAAELERKIRGRALVARTELWLARALAARRGDGDLKRASEVAHRVVNEAGAMGMALVEQQAVEVLSSLS